MVVMAVESKPIVSHSCALSTVDSVVPWEQGKLPITHVRDS
jgi:hypothetical protein